MKKITVFLLTLFLCFFIFISYLKPALAVSYSLVAPSETLTRGETYTFTINIDTDDATITTGEIGMTYESEYLEYVSTTPGAAMDSVTTTQNNTETLTLTGTNSDGFNGSSVFAYVKFKLIAASAGSTTLCALWVPSGTPTPTPTGTTSTNEPTSTPAVTSLPTSGATGKGTLATYLGIAFVVVFGAFYYLDKKIAFKRPKKK